jgi:hypothetical protein
VQQYPQVLRMTQEAEAQLRVKNAQVAKAYGQDIPANIREPMRALTGAVVQMRVNHTAMRDMIRAAVAEAKRQGTIASADLADLAELGLAGYEGPGSAALSRSSGTTAAIAAKGGTDVPGMGAFPVIAVAAASAIVAASAAVYGVSQASAAWAKATAEKNRALSQISVASINNGVPLPQVVVEGLAPSAPRVLDKALSGSLIVVAAIVAGAFLLKGKP